MLDNRCVSSLLLHKKLPQTLPRTLSHGICGQGPRAQFRWVLQLGGPSQAAVMPPGRAVVSSEGSMGAGFASKLTHVAVHRIFLVRHENEDRDSSLAGGQRLPSVSCRVHFSSLLSQCKCARSQKESVYGEDGSHSILGLNDNTDIPSPLRYFIHSSQVTGSSPCTRGEGGGYTRV